MVEKRRFNEPDTIEEQRIRAPPTEPRESLQAGGGMAQKSPEDVKRLVKERVAKVTAAASGALEGFAHQTEPRALGEATRKATQTLRQLGGEVRHEVKQARREGLLKSEAEIQAKKARESQEPGTMGKAQEQATKGMQKARQRATQTMQKARKSMEDMSPEEIRRQTREAVGRATARITGAAEGYAEQAEPKLAGEAVRKVGETVREVGHEVKRETQKGSAAGGAELAGGAAERHRIE